ncbi:hypothetical protein FRB91_007669 [Serendipita sp. 411]|nr:hypothetical protein FRC15_009957 [Serendipita sp. 397]KAG8803078.1 hypothetical protein FRC16_007400 [Serendipita sp. 398]KAG8825857.1 hypothetical protein FRC19_010331 [Serendipita sp. 401]KAG8859483.1 hypothetical protein FRB91_007669 [Serendipita sp. 411]KAG8872296.1 hypothetical protein FRC20_009598 [Serendipita sp. 405]KAG9057826.1 hypothetical protein FS842_003901 [Serendipita sp. 407]
MELSLTRWISPLATCCGGYTRFIEKNQELISWSHSWTPSRVCVWGRTAASPSGSISVVSIIEFFQTPVCVCVSLSLSIQEAAFQCYRSCNVQPSDMFSTGLEAGE